MKTTVADLGIGEEELLWALSAARPTQDNDAGWFSVEELTELLSLGTTTVRKRLTAMVKAGTLDYKRVARISALGNKYRCNAFRMKPGHTTGRPLPNDNEKTLLSPTT